MFRDGNDWKFDAIQGVRVFVIFAPFADSAGSRNAKAGKRLLYLTARNARGSVREKAFAGTTTNFIVDDLPKGLKRNW